MAGHSRWTMRSFLSAVPMLICLPIQEWRQMCRWLLPMFILLACGSAVGDAQASSGRPYTGPRLPPPDSALISGIPHTEIAGSGIRWGMVSRHMYSKAQAFNCDNSLIWTFNFNEELNYVFTDRVSGEVAYVHKPPGREARWLPRSKDSMLIVKDNELAIWNVETGESESIVVTADLTKLHIGPYEGNISWDGKRVVVTGERVGSPADKESLLIDLDTGEIISRLAHPTHWRVDWISVSASGNYIVLNGMVEPGYNDSSVVLDTQFQPVGESWLVYGQPSHFDLALDLAGQDVAIGVSKSRPHDGKVIMRRLKDGAITALTSHGYARHTSVRNIHSAQWALVTYEGYLQNWPPFANEIVAVKLDGSGEVRLQEFLPTDGSYWSQPQASISADGRHMIWAQFRREMQADGSRAVGTAVAPTGLPIPVSVDACL